jgi:hypothetical protein
MAKWINTVDGVVDLDKMFYLESVQVSTDWFVDGYMPEDRTTRALRYGPFATQAEADASINSVTQAFDPLA